MSAASDPTDVGAGRRGLALSGNNVVRVSDLVAACGDEVKRNVGQLLNQIVQLRIDQPWGDDEVGAEFAKMYNALVDGRIRYHEFLEAVLTDAGGELIKEFGPGGRFAVQLYEELDSGAFRTRRTG